MICFDMDGTIADLYSVENWLPRLHNEETAPYKEAAPIWSVEALNAILNALVAKGEEIRIITWASKGASKEYRARIAEVKREWLEDNGFPFTHFHCVQYGATKANSVRRYLKNGEKAILIDDNAKIRAGWTLGNTIDPTRENIIDYLIGLLEE